jgi:hypothetical protein
MSKDEYIRNNSNKTLVITCLDHIIDEYRFTFNSELVYCSGKNEFIEKVSNILGIENIYISNTNESKNIVRWEK